MYVHNGTKRSMAGRFGEGDDGREPCGTKDPVSTPNGRPQMRVTGGHLPNAATTKNNSMDLPVLSDMIGRVRGRNHAVAQPYKAPSHQTDLYHFLVLYHDRVIYTSILCANVLVS